MKVLEHRLADVQMNLKKQWQIILNVFMS